MPNVQLAERVFLAADTAETPQHVAFLATFLIPDGAPATYVHDLADRLRSQTTLATPFNYKLKNVSLRAVAPSWEIVPDGDVDFDYHFRHSALPRPGGERELGVLVSRLHSQPLDPARPLWEFHLIEGLDGNRFAFYFKAHHALMDGVGGVKRMRRMIGPDPDSTDLRALWTIGPSQSASTPRAATALSDLIRTVGGLGSTAAGLARAATGMALAALRGVDADLAVPFDAPRSVINGRIGRQRRVATQTFEFDRIRKIAKAGNVTINDVFLAICAGGLRRYLLELKDLPGQSLTAGTPVNIREETDDTSTNAFSMVVVKLRTDVADPLERLAAIARSSDTAKNHLRGMGKGLREQYAATFMGPFVVQNVVGLGGRVPPPYNVSISNVPGPVEPQYLVGARLEALYPLALLYHGVALFIALFTASGQLGVGFVGDRDGLPHLQRVAVYTGEALDELEKALAV